MLGAERIRRQYQQQLPMLEGNVLDYCHRGKHVIAASYRIFGEGTPAAQPWREKMMGVVLEEGPLRFLEDVGQLRKTMGSSINRKALESLQQYVGVRVEMLDYPAFRAKGWQIGSGPPEADCKTLTARLKDPGMRWDKPNAERMMALASIRSSRLWDHYWILRRNAAA